LPAGIDAVYALRYDGIPERLAFVAAQFGFVFLVSFVMGGPIWVPLMLFLRGFGRRISGHGSVTGGREPKSISFRPFGRHRKEADTKRELFLGVGRTSGKPVLIGEEPRLMHTWVVGATGTGKTQSALLPAIRADIMAGRPLVFIDGKGDRSTFAAVAAFATLAKYSAPQFRDPPGALYFRGPRRACSTGGLAQACASPSKCP
jgi:hypothetical protein